MYLLRLKELLSTGCKAIVLLPLILACPACAAPLQLHVSGSTLRDSHDRVVWLRGVCIPSLEWSNSGEHIPKSTKMALSRQWNCNIIRLPICQDRWMGKASGQIDGGADYRAIIDKVVNTVSMAGGYVIVDEHWSDMGVWDQDLAQHNMPDDNSTACWTDIAKHFKNNPAVVFGIFNEPHDISWTAWRDGGSVSEKCNNVQYTYHSPGMQGLVEAVRAQDAKNVIFAGGNTWAGDLSGITKGYALKDSDGGHGIAYDMHIYPPDTGFAGRMSAMNSGYCVFIGEFGGSPTYYNGDVQKATDWTNLIFPWIMANHYNFTAWDLHPASGPCLISDWNYTPTPYFGVIAKNALEIIAELHTKSGKQ